MDTRLINSSRQIVAKLRATADALDMLARQCDEPKRSYYRRKAKTLRSHAGSEERNLKTLMQAVTPK